MTKDDQRPKRPRQSAAMKEKWTDLEARARMTAAIEKAWADPVKHERITTAMKLSHRTPEFRELMRAKTTQAWVTRKRAMSARMTAAIEAVERAAGERAGGDISRAEIIRVEPQRGMPDLAMLDRLIQKRVAEAQATAQGLLLEPWFQPADVADELRRRLGVFHSRKFALYYELWGCLVCRKKTEVHVGHGLCNSCYSKFSQRLKAIEKQYAETHPHEYVDQQIDRISSRVRSAERILGTKRVSAAEEDPESPTAENEEE